MRSCKKRVFVYFRFNVALPHWLNFLRSVGCGRWLDKVRSSIVQQRNPTEEEEEEAEEEEQEVTGWKHSNQKSSVATVSREAAAWSGAPTVLHLKPLGVSSTAAAVPGAPALTTAAASSAGTASFKEPERKKRKKQKESSDTE